MGYGYDSHVLDRLCVSFAASAAWTSPGALRPEAQGWVDHAGTRGLLGTVNSMSFKGVSLLTILSEFFIVYFHCEASIHRESKEAHLASGGSQLPSCFMDASRLLCFEWLMFSTWFNQKLGHWAPSGPKRGAGRPSDHGHGPMAWSCVLTRQCNWKDC